MEHTSDRSKVDFRVMKERANFSFHLANFFPTPRVTVSTARRVVNRAKIKTRGKKSWEPRNPGLD